MNSFEVEYIASNKELIKIPERFDWITRSLILVGFILWGVIVYMAIQAVHYGIIK